MRPPGEAFVLTTENLTQEQIFGLKGMTSLHDLNLSSSLAPEASHLNSLERQK